MRTLMLSTLFLATFANATLLDFYYLDKAKKAYEAKEYAKAAKNYGKVDNDAAKFNEADSLYRQQKYEEAVKLYKQIKDPNLTFQKLHNIGNSYANMHKSDEAIKAYEAALKIKQDKDTQYNLALLKQQKEEKQKQQQKQENQNAQKQNQQEQKNGQQENDKQKEQEQQQSDQKNQPDENKAQNAQSQNSDQPKEDKKEQKPSQTSQQSQDQNQEEKEKPQEAAAMQATENNPPISNMEERKWQKMLNQRGINTLMLPMNPKGDTNDETKPW